MTLDFPVVHTRGGVLVRVGVTRGDDDQSVDSVSERSGHGRVGSDPSVGRRDIGNRRTRSPNPGVTFDEESEGTPLSARERRRT